MKKSLVITATFMMVFITAKGSLNVKTVKYDNLLVNPNINSNDSQKFWSFYTVHLIVNIIDINGTVINNEYCYGEPGTYTGLSQFYDPTGYELVGATDNGVKLDKIQAENLVVPEFLGDSSEIIDYIVKPVKKKSKDEPSKSKDDSSIKNENKNTDTKQSNMPNVKNDTSNDKANKNNVDKNDANKNNASNNQENKSKINKNDAEKNDVNKNNVHRKDTSNNKKNKSETNKNNVNKNDLHKNDKSDNSESKINNGTIKKKSSDTKSLVNSKNKEDGNNNNQIDSDSSTSNHNKDINKSQPQGIRTGFGIASKINSDKTNKYVQHKSQLKSEPKDESKIESESEPVKFVKSKLEKITKIISESNEQINSSVTVNKSLIPYSLKDTKKIVTENSTQNSQNSTKKASVIKKNPYLAVSGIVEVSVNKNSKELNNFKSKDNLPDSKQDSNPDCKAEEHKNSEKHMFRFEIPIVSMCITDDSNDIPNSKIQHTDVGGKSNFSINSAYIKSKGLLIITALIGIISALSLAIKPKK